MSVPEIFDQFCEEGWNDSTKLQLLMLFIESLPRNTLLKLVVFLADNVSNKED
jgi:hypothetical protein